jgi:hypothetical protein
MNTASAHTAFYRFWTGLAAATLLNCCFHTSAAEGPGVVVDIKIVEAPPAQSNSFFVGNKPPLQPSPLLKLPIGSIVPKGWLRHQLELEAEGMIGHLPEISKWCKFEDNAWAATNGQGHSGWEELPYWLKGYGDLGYVLGDQKIIAAARKWIDAVLASQHPDGWFGPTVLKTGLKGKPDLWPHMVMCNVLQSFHEYSGDARVIPFLSRYFQWLSTQPNENFGAGYWPKIRFGDNIETLYWLYNRTGESRWLDLAKRIHEHMQDWTTGVHDWHNVNIAQGFREPGIYFQQARESRFLAAADRNYRTVLDMYGQFPGGGFGGDENCRPGYTDPRQGFETCGIVEFMHSFQLLTRVAAETIWADRCEELAFNSLPASLTPDLKALHYLTCANQVQLDRKNKAPGIQNSGTMFSYSPLEVYRCCQHNVSHGWPYYAEELWLATGDRGLCASLYAASEVTAKAGDGAQVKISEQTDYPFSDTITFKISMDQPASFPLYLRIPNWCANPSLKINGTPAPVKARPSAYLAVSRKWSSGDVVTLQLPMKLAVRTWPKNNNAVSVHYGPLAFSLKIQERWNRYGGTDAFPESEVFAQSPWNYGLVLDQRQPEKSFEIVVRTGAVPSQPFTLENTPIQLSAQARKIPAWKMDSRGMVGKLQPSPAKSSERVEKITLVPMGAARLRIASFPVIGSGPNAHEWVEPKPSAVSASHCYESDTVEAVNDGLEPKTSSDRNIPRFTWWDHRGTREWVQYDFGKPRKVSSCAVYWFDDTGSGSCRVPQSWKLLYREGAGWKPVETTSAFKTDPNAYNQVRFSPVETTALRIEVNLRPDVSGGILEWKIEDL